MAEIKPNESIQRRKPGIAEKLAQHYKRMLKSGLLRANKW